MENFLSTAVIATLASAVASWITTLIMRNYFGSYLSEKGKNLATKEDIADIVTIQEKAKQPFSLEMEASKARHNLRMAAVDRRLQAHQEAFALWRELVAQHNSPGIGEVVLRCQKWWENNCLFLEPEVREAFSLAYTRVHAHSVYLKNPDSAKFLEQSWADIMNAGNTILEAVSLPPLSEVEKKPL